MDGCSIFRDELAIRYPTHGHALWEPDPGGRYHAVEVGDVGFIRKGRFHRLFNALHPRDTILDSDASHGLTYPPKLKPRDPNHMIEGIDSHRDFHSTSVTMTQEDTQASRSDDIPLKFDCSATRGALLCLPFPAKIKETIALGDFSKWLIENIDGCFKVAADLGYGVKRMEDIVLVTGCYLAKSWISAAFTASHERSEVSFTIRMSGDSGVYIEKRSASGELKVGPIGQNLSENQCVFVQGYRVARIMKLWPRKIRAAGSAPDLHDPEPESDMPLESIGIPSEADHPSLFHTLLNYIAEQTPNCDMILVHDKDLGFMGSGGTLGSDSLIEHIRSHAPAIRQVRCKLGNEDRSGAEAEDVMIATLSQDSFGALREDHTLECSHPLDALRRIGSETSPIVLRENAATQRSNLSRLMPVSSGSGPATSSPISISSPTTTWTEPPWSGWIETTGDALLILEAGRRGMIPRVTRRLIDSERKMITSGSVFVFDEDESGIKRWTDGFLWSPSRILGNFLLYCETEKRGVRTDAIDQGNPPAGVGGGGGGGGKSEGQTLSRLRGETTQLGISKQRVRSLVGSYKFKVGGMMKKTFSLTINGVSQHLISYYKIEDVEQGRLRTPSSYPELASLDISPEYLEKTHFRKPPKVEIGIDGVSRYLGEADDVEPSPHVVNSMLVVGTPLLSESMEVAATTGDAANVGKGNMRFDHYPTRRGKSKLRSMEGASSYPTYSSSALPYSYPLNFSMPAPSSIYLPGPMYPPPSLPSPSATPPAGFSSSPLPVQASSQPMVPYHGYNSASPHALPQSSEGSPMKTQAQSQQASSANHGESVEAS